MKAAIVEKPGLLVVREIPMPEVGEYEALCELLYGATCSGTDHHILRGYFPWPIIHYPTVLGHESIGRVVRTGSKVRNLKAGDLVTRVGAPASAGLNVSWGGFAEYGVACDYRAMCDDGRPRAEWDGYRIHQVLPPDTDPRGATMVITWRETFSYIRRMGVGPGASVLVIGSGGNGLAFAAHAANLGAERIIVVGNSMREGAACGAGASSFIDYRIANLPDALQRAAGPGFDYVIDSVGKAGQVDLALPFLAAGGTVGIYGIDEYWRCNMNPHLARGTFTFYNGGYDEEEAHEAVAGFMQKGALRADVWLDLKHPFPLEEIDAALQAVAERRMVKALVRLHATAN